VRGASARARSLENRSRANRTHCLALKKAAMSYAPLTSEPPVVVRVDDGVQTESPKVSSATPSSPVAFRKSWRGGLLDCFGDCSSSDFGSCCLVFWVPFVAFGCVGQEGIACWPTAAARAASLSVCKRTVCGARASKHSAWRRRGCWNRSSCGATAPPHALAPPRPQSQHA
jgi:hypothetical protein